MSLLSDAPSFLRGERYIGMWQADRRHGPGVMITRADVYQGTFQGDKMAVSGSPCLGHSVGELKPRWVGDKDAQLCRHLLWFRHHPGCF